MNGDILALNVGSSSLKLALYAAKGEQALARGQVDHIGPDGALKLRDAHGTKIPAAPGADLTTHPTAMTTVLASLKAWKPNLHLAAVGHRVVHGGAFYDAPILLDEASADQLQSLSSFAPLHQPHNLAGIHAAQMAFPDVPQIACFDTAFHRNHPWVNDTFALPQRFYEQGVRRYGFHGLSYHYITQCLSQNYPELARGRVVVAHLGNGASMCGIKDGQSIASTMGFTALDGLPMGTRCGQLDPGLVLYLIEQQGMSAAEVSELLYKESGLLGLSGLSHDMRVLEASDEPAAAQAIEYFVFRCRREIGAMAAALGGVDALVFTGGIGENASQVRAAICEELGWMGLAIDPERNIASTERISPDGYKKQILVLPTNEEQIIAQAARSLISYSQATRI